MPDPGSHRSRAGGLPAVSLVSRGPCLLTFLLLHGLVRAAPRHPQHGAAWSRCLLGAVVCSCRPGSVALGGCIPLCPSPWGQGHGQVLQGAAGVRFLESTECLALFLLEAGGRERF